MQVEEIKSFINEKIDELKARDVLELDVSQKSSFTQCMLICSGNSKQHVRSIAKHVALEAKRSELEMVGIEGEDTGEWVLVDFGDVILHVMTDEQRDHYQIEKLWQ
ncbi:ribosome silencing factor [Catenovulum maritimum]|uniref:Ribosomal silencing factor RsfS n=1 Tax=Catenovulum maritimum TaxID=1513271 RepID=A0A0J8JNJ0_9ALTE|nr:ribosome silencing factor [Catenovulum maritimum]KMT66186.1 ribosome-associated protein [Catenovulum maritimum]